MVDRRAIHVKINIELYIFLLEMRLKFKLRRLKQPVIAQARRMPFVQQVQELRYTMQLSQEKFTDELGMTFATLNHWKNGHATPSRLALEQMGMLLNQLAEFADVTLRERGQAMRGKYFLDRKANA